MPTKPAGWDEPDRLNRENANREPVPANPPSSGVGDTPGWTPGEWTQQQTTLGICRLIVTVEDVQAIEINPATDPGYAIAYLPNETEEAQQAANANLIIHASKLYFALQRAARALRFASTPEARAFHFNDIAEELEHLCAKARGEKPNETRPNETR